MSHSLIADDRSRSTYSAVGFQNNAWKKNLNGEKDSHHSKSENRNRRDSKHSRPSDNIVPVPTGGGMNHNYLKQQQYASNGTSNQNSSNSMAAATATASNQASSTNLNLNNVVSVQNSNNSSHSNGQQGNNAAWLQHMILNPINPLHSNPSSVGGNVGGNSEGVISNQGNSFARQQQLQVSLQGNTSHHAYRQQQGSNQVGNGAMSAQSIAKTLTIQQQNLTQPVVSSRPQQQQQNLHQLLPLNGLVSQLQQVPAVRQTQPLQQQQAPAPSSNNNQVGAMQNSVSAAAQQQQQQQLLLLALMLQQQNNANNNSSGVDTSALSNALTSPEGLRLINSLLVGQIQGNRVQQQQQPTQVPQGLNVVAGPGHAPAPAPASLGADLLSHSFGSGIQDDALSNNHQFFLTQQQQQPQTPKPSQPPALNQPMQLPTLSFLNTNMQSLTPAMLGNTGESPIGNTAINFPTNSISSLTMKAGSEGAKAGDGKVIGSYQNRNGDKSGKDSNTPSSNSRFPRLLYCESDDAILGEYQTLLRQQLELFEADSHDVINGTFRQGRTTPIRLGQIGLRCKHCAKAPMSARTKGSIYFSQTIKGMYQIGQNMSKVHLCERCPRLPPDIKKRMVTLRSRRHRASGGRAYWIRHLREMGIYEDGTVLRAHPPGKKPPNGKPGNDPNNTN